MVFSREKTFGIYFYFCLFLLAQQIFSKNKETIFGQKLKIVDDDDQICSIFNGFYALTELKNLIGSDRLLIIDLFAKTKFLHKLLVLKTFRRTLDGHFFWIWISLGFFIFYTPELLLVFSFFYQKILSFIEWIIFNARKDKK